MRTTTSAEVTAPPPGGAVTRVRAWSRVALRVLAAAWCWTLVWLLLWTFVPRIAGWDPVVIESGSMSPLIRIGDVIVADTDVTIDDLEPGQIVTYVDPVNRELTTHRVDAVDDGSITTKGDANPVADTTAIEGSDLHGRARLVVPVIGMPRVFFGEGRLLEGLGWMALTGGALWLALSPPRGGRGARSGRSEPPPEPPEAPGATGGGRVRRALRPVTAGGLAVLTLVGVGPTSTAAFASVTDSVGNSFAAAADFGYSLYADEVLADGPEAYWRLGDTAALPAPVFNDDFEVFTGWNQFGAGTVAPTSFAHNGSGALVKDFNNDPSGGWKALGTTLGGEWTLQAWLYRPSSSTGGSIDRLGIEDASFNGYSFGASHGANSLFIDRRTGGNPSGSLASVAFDPPEDEWYRLVLSRSANGLTVTAYDGGGTTLASTSTVDATYSSFDRVVIHGGHTYYVDDIAIWDAASGTAVDETGVHSAPYQGGPTLGAPRLLSSGIDTAVRFDGVDDTVAVADHPGINLATHDRRTVELWYQADDPAPRQVLYEEGG
ncbi:MAG: signal peptidase I, partial [Actinomycetota bacterium]